MSLSSPTTDFLEYFNKNMHKHNFPKVPDYKLCLTGTISAGKSTILEILSQMFHGSKFLSNTLGDQTVYTYPEKWVSDPVGLELLSRKISGQISIGTFQNYVIDEWINNMSQPINHQTYNIHLFERNVDDTVYTFCNFAYRKKQLSELEFQTLFDRALETQMKYKIPSYSSLRNFSRVKSTNIWSDVLSIAKIIEKDIYEDEIDQRIIGLDVDNETALKRVVERGRQAEQQYTVDYLREFNEFYKKLFDYLESDKTINSIHELCFKL